MTEEQNQGGLARVPERDYPPFSEPREWKPCPVCGGGDPYKRSRALRALAGDPCPECGQPPRCWAGRKNDHCPRPATIDLPGTGLLTHCGQHYADNVIRYELEEQEGALEHLEPFLQTARLIGTGGIVLVDLLESARAEAETKVAGYRSEIARIWEGG